MSAEKRIQDYLAFLYGRETGSQICRALLTRLGEFRNRHPNLASAGKHLTEHDSFVIAYGDHVTAPGQPPLQTLAEIFEAHLDDAIGGVHLLPHFPYSSDDGFSVIDYRQVNPALGDWPDVARVGKRYRLMFDGVINHISSQSEWFRAFLRSESPYTDYFITCDPATDLSAVVRPRALPLLTPVETAAGRRHVWTTFSDDQIDLNFKNPAVLLEIIDLLLFYAGHGAEVIRLDAIAYLWKEVGTSCIHLPQTHCVVKLFRAALDFAAPGVLLITETNVPHPDNISYFGDGTDEAQMVYNFALPPLVLHTFRTGNAACLARWAATLAPPSTATTFFNFIASHDGIGVMPARGLLTPEEIVALVELAQAHGGQVSYKSNADGTKSPYELNVTLFDALNDPAQPNDDVDVRRFLASQTIMLSLAGVPGIYFPSLIGARNWQAGVAETGRARTINRQKFTRARLETELAASASRTRRVFDGYRRLLRARREQRTFHPHAAQQILPLGDAVFALARTTPDNRETVLVLINVTREAQSVVVDQFPQVREWQDLLTGKRFAAAGGRTTVRLTGYESLWLRG